MDKEKHLHRCARDRPSSRRPVVDGAFGGVLARPGLSRRDREMAIAWGVRYARERGRRSQVSDWAVAMRPFEGLEVQDRLARVEIRPLVLAGELDASCTPEITAAVAERFPGALYKELPGTPHMQTLERPELVAQALDRFLPTSMPGCMEQR